MGGSWTITDGYTFSKFGIDVPSGGEVDAGLDECAPWEITPSAVSLFEAAQLAWYGDGKTAKA